MNQPPARQGRKKNVQIEQNKEKRLRKNKEMKRELQDKKKYNNTCIIGKPE